MPVFEDDEEAPKGAAAVADALSGSDESAPPESMPDTVEPVQPVQASSDTSAQDIGAYESEQPEPSRVPATIQTPSGEEEQPLTAPAAPVFKPYSQDAENAANELAQEKSDFAAKVASGAYKPSLWRNIGAGVAAAAAGWRGGALEGGRVGQAIRSAPLDKATSEEQLKEQGTLSKIAAGDRENADIQRENQNAATTANWADRDFANQARVRDWEAQVQQRKAYAEAKLAELNKTIPLTPVDPNDRYGEYQGVSNSGQPIRGLEPPPQIQKEPGYKIHQNLLAIKSMRDAGIKLTPQQQTYLAANGRLNEASETKIYNPPQGAAEFAAYEKSLGHPPTTQDILNYKRGDAANNPEAGDQVSSIVADAMQKKQNFADAYERDAAGNYVLSPDLNESVNQPGKLSPKEFADRIELIGRTTPNRQLSRFGRQIDQNGNLVGGNQPAPTAAPAVATTPKATAPTQQPGAAGTVVQFKGKSMTVGKTRVVVNGKQGTFMGINDNGQAKVNWDK